MYTIKIHTLFPHVKSFHGIVKKPYEIHIAPENKSNLKMLIVKGYVFTKQLYIVFYRNEFFLWNAFSNLLKPQFPWCYYLTKFSIVSLLYKLKLLILYCHLRAIISKNHLFSMK